MEEHRQRVARATSAATLGDLHGLLTDLQLSDPPAGPGKPTGVPVWVIVSAVAAVVAVVGALIAWGVSDRDTTPAAGQAPPAAVGELVRNRPRPPAGTSCGRR